MQAWILLSLVVLITARGDWGYEHDDHSDDHHDGHGYHAHNEEKHAEDDDDGYHAKSQGKHQDDHADEDDEEYHAAKPQPKSKYGDDHEDEDEGHKEAKPQPKSKYGDDNEDEDEGHKEAKPQPKSKYGYDHEDEDEGHKEAKPQPKSKYGDDHEDEDEGHKEAKPKSKYGEDEGHKEEAKPQEDDEEKCDFDGRDKYGVPKKLVPKDSEIVLLVKGKGYRAYSWQKDSKVWRETGRQVKLTDPKTHDCVGSISADATSEEPANTSVKYQYSYFADASYAIRTGAKVNQTNPCDKHSAPCATYEISSSSDYEGLLTGVTHVAVFDTHGGAPPHHKGKADHQVVCVEESATYAFYRSAAPAVNPLPKKQYGDYYESYGDSYDTYSYKSYGDSYDSYGDNYDSYGDYYDYQ